MQPRLQAQKASPGAYHAMLGLEMFVRKSSKLEAFADRTGKDARIADQRVCFLPRYAFQRRSGGGRDGTTLVRA